MFKVMVESRTPQQLAPPGTSESTAYGLFDADNEANNVDVWWYQQSDDEYGTTPTAMHVLVNGKRIPSRLDPGGTIQAQEQDINNGVDISRVWVVTDAAQAPTPGSTIAAGAIVINLAADVRTRTLAAFDVPAVGSNVSVNLDTTIAGLLAVDAEIPIGEALYQVVSIDDASHATVKNLGVPVAPMTVAVR